MQRYSISILLILTGIALFWAFMMIDTLLREFSADVAFIDLGVLVIMGFIAGLAVGSIPAARRREVKDT